jgi:hypothetical protein
MNWSYADLLDAPAELVDEIAAVMDEQATARERGR